jgi:hypothetical protein
LSVVSCQRLRKLSVLSCRFSVKSTLLNLLVRSSTFWYVAMRPVLPFGGFALSRLLSSSCRCQRKLSVVSCRLSVPEEVVCSQLSVVSEEHSAGSARAQLDVLVCGYAAVSLPCSAGSLGGDAFCASAGVRGSCLSSVVGCQRRGSLLNLLVRSLVGAKIESNRDDDEYPRKPGAFLGAA